MQQKTVKRIRVLVVDDSRLGRDGIAAMLSRSDVEIVATAAGCHEAVQRVREERPHVVLFDAGLGNQDTPRLIAEVRQAALGIKVIVTNLLPFGEEIVKFVKAGVSGLVPHDATPAEVLKTIRSVAGGADVLPPVLTRTLFSYIAEDGVGADAPAGLDRIGMTRRELEIFRLIAAGLANREIAQRLGVALHTVKGHVHHILKKLAFQSRVQIAVYAHSRGRTLRLPLPDRRVWQLADPENRFLSNPAEA